MRTGPETQPSSTPNRWCKRSYGSGGGQVRARHEVIGEKIRRNRRAEGYTQESLADALGVDRTTVGKWERGTAWPSAKNLRVLVKRRLLDASTLRGAGDSRTGWEDLFPPLSERVATTFGCEMSELRARTLGLRDDAERVLVAFYRMLPVAQQGALLEIVSSMKTTQLPKE